MKDILSTAESELAEIERKLAEMQPLVQRRDQLRTFLAIGRTLYAEPVATLPLLVQAANRAQAAALNTPKAEGTLKARVVEAVAAMISAEGPMRTREIVRRLEAQGIEFGGSNKIDTVSVILSRSKDRFQPDRSLGWSLVQSHNETTPPVAPTTAGS